MQATGEEVMNYRELAMKTCPSCDSELEIRNPGGGDFDATNPEGLEPCDCTSTPHPGYDPRYAFLRQECECDCHTDPYFTGRGCCEELHIGSIVPVPPDVALRRLMERMPSKWVLWNSGHNYQVGEGAHTQGGVRNNVGHGATPEDAIADSMEVER